MKIKCAECKREIDLDNIKNHCLQARSLEWVAISLSNA